MRGRPGAAAVMTRATQDPARVTRLFPPGSSIEVPELIIETGLEQGGVAV